LRGRLQLLVTKLYHSSGILRRHNAAE